MTRRLPRAVVSVLLASALAVPAGHAQQPAASPASGSAPVFPVQAHIVWIDVVAADSRGRPRPDLGAEDFEVFEGGHRRPIVLFRAPDAGAASRALVFLVDDIAFRAPQLARARDVVRRVLSKAASGDRVVVRATASGVSASAELPAGRAELEAALERIRPHPDLDTALDAGLAQRLQWGRVEAVVAALQALQGHPGPRALVVIGPSFPYRVDGPFGSTAYERVMRASERAAAPVYFLRSGEDAPRASSPAGAPDWITGTSSVIGVAPLLPMAPGASGRAGQALLDAIATDSGGFTAPDASGWAWAVDRILAPRAYYLLGIPSVPESWDGEYHAVEVRVPRHDVRLVSRAGYFAPAAEAPR